jgi:hypothetical protein
MKLPKMGSVVRMKCEPDLSQRCQGLPSWSEQHSNRMQANVVDKNGLHPLHCETRLKVVPLSLVDGYSWLTKTACIVKGASVMRF